MEMSAWGTFPTGGLWMSPNHTAAERLQLTLHARGLNKASECDTFIPARTCHRASKLIGDVAMTAMPSREPLHQPKESPELKIIGELLRAKATSDIRSPHFWIILVLMAGFGYVYYGVLTAFHDVYIILFFYPLIYAAIIYRLRGAIGTWVIFLGIFLPHALLFSNDPYSLARSLLFAAFALIVSGLIATQLNYLERQLEANREILSLNEELRKYIERLQNTQRQLLQAEKMNALGQLSASIAHEINNPLAGTLVYTKLLSKKIGSDPSTKERRSPICPRSTPLSATAPGWCGGFWISLASLSRCCAR